MLRSRTLVSWFESQVAAAPDRPAVTAEGRTLSYAEVDRRANQLARRLQSLGVGPDHLVALYLPRTADLVIGILATLKAGGAYVPLDEAYPRERLAFVLEDSRPVALVTTRAVRHAVPEFAGPIVDLEGDREALGQLSAGRVEAALDPAHLAYVIYTSGSTGKPKGALITHANVVRLFTTTESLFGFNSADVWTLFHSAAFDFSVWEMWGALLYGGRLVVVPAPVTRAPDAFRELLSAERVTVLNQTPSAFRQLIHADSEAQDPLALRFVIFGGEALDLHTLRPWVGRHGTRPQLVNMYGITETTVHVTWRPLTGDEIQAGLGSVIGRPLPDLTLYLLDERLREVADGDTGELFVAGPGLARGYLRRDELTRERFLASPFPDTPGGRLYRTGDLARRLPDGEYLYLGRADDQVKIRGFRVEVGEVESALRTVPGIADAAVTARADGRGQRHLIGYVVPSNGSAPTAGALRQALMNRLPRYMVPAAFVFLDSIPLTPNGKVDRRALPVPDPGRREAVAQYVPPRTSTEGIIANVWCDVLRLERVGVHDNFFELGGDSLSIVDVTDRLRRSFPRLDVVTLFEHPSLASLAEALDAGGTPEGRLTSVEERARQQRSARERRRKARGGGRHDA